MAENLWMQPGAYDYEGIQMGGYTTHENTTNITNYGGFRDGDCIVASFPKTGTTLTQEIAFLIYHDGDIKKAMSEPVWSRVPFMEDTSSPHDPVNTGLELVKTKEHPKIAKTHLPFHLIPISARQKKVKMIYACRNPKDMLVSYYNFYKSASIFGPFHGEFSEYLRLFWHDKIDYGNFFDHVRSWEKGAKDHDVLIVKYEDTLRDKKLVVKRIAEFLGKSLSDDVMERISDHTSFNKMKQNPMTNYVDEQLMNDEVSSFMRKGIVGDWKNYFTVAENEQINAYIAQQTQTIETKFDYI